MTLILTRSADGRDRRVGRHRGTAHRRGSLEHAPLAGEPALAAAEREPAQGQRVPAHHSILGRVSRGPQCDRRSVGSSPATPAAAAAPCTLLRRVRSASQPSSPPPSLPPPCPAPPPTPAAPSRPWRFQPRAFSFPTPSPQVGG